MMRIPNLKDRCGRVVLLATIFSLALFGVTTMTGYAEKLTPPGTMEPRGDMLTAPLKVNPKLPGAKPKGSCHVSGELPDSTCTPGVADGNVTQQNIQQTICVPGYSKKIRNKYAPVNYTDALKKLQIREYGYQDTRPSSYEE